MKDERPRAVKCRLYVDGKVIEFDLPGPLISFGKKKPRAKK